GSANFTFQCFTKSGNQPQGAPNGVSFSGLSTETTITPHNGQITATVCLQPEQDGASCQGQGLKLCLIAVDYESVTFTDSTTPLSLAASATANLSASGLEVCGFKNRP